MDWIRKHFVDVAYEVAEGIEPMLQQAPSRHWNVWVHGEKVNPKRLSLIAARAFAENWVETGHRPGDKPSINVVDSMPEGTGNVVQTTGQTEPPTGSTLVEYGRSGLTAPQNAQDGAGQQIDTPAEAVAALGIPPAQPPSVQLDADNVPLTAPPIRSPNAGAGFTGTTTDNLGRQIEWENGRRKTEPRPEPMQSANHHTPPVRHLLTMGKGCRVMVTA